MENQLFIGFLNVFSQITINPWDKELCNKVMDLAIDVCRLDDLGDCSFCVTIYY